MPFRIPSCFLLLISTILPVWAQPAPVPGENRAKPLTQLIPGASFSPGIPSPAVFLGVETGARPLRPEELVRYFEALAATSPRAELIEYARSFEGRKLLALAVSDEGTVSRLDEFRGEHRRRLDPRGRAPEADAPALAGAKAVAWMAYSIHGDELSSSDAAAALAYWLVAGEDEKATRLRRDLVILIDPCQNPDGRERFLSMTTAYAGAVPNPDSEDLSHTAVWPWGRGNHYLFDLNRDWISMIMPESRRGEVIAAWQPQLVVDSHEMGPDDTYLFSPPRHPFNPFLAGYACKWWDRFSADQARSLDARGYAYYGAEWNEEFFPGYGSSWAAYLGAIGILYEMSSTEGTAVRQRGGTWRTFAETVEHQLTSSIANLETLASNREAILRDVVAGHRETVRRGAAGPVGAWIISPGRDPQRAGALAGLLRRQGIEVLRLRGPVKASGLKDARTGKPADRELPAGTWLVPLDQPAGRLARVLLDPHVPMEKPFLREEREYLERGRGTRLYDATAWSLLFSFGVEAYWTTARPSGDWSAEPAPETEPVFQPLAFPFGYLIDGIPDRVPFALADLLSRGIAVRVAEKPFRVSGRAFGPGTLLIKREGNPGDLAEALAQVAGRWKIEITGTTTAKAEEGPDLGGNYFYLLVAPRIGVFAGFPVSPGGYGAVWHLLDRQAGMRFTSLDIGRFFMIDLSRYNVLVFPPAMGSLEAVLGKVELDRLRTWIEAGGTAIGISGSAEFLADRKTGLTQARVRRQALENFPPVVWGAGSVEAEAAGPLRAAGIRAPEPAAPSGETGKGKPAPAPPTPSPEVPPVLGPGARPFAEGAGADWALPPANLAAWLKPFLAPGKEKPETQDLERADERLRRFSPRGVFLRTELDAQLWMNWGLPGAMDVWIDARDTLVAEPPVQVAARFAGLEALHLGGLLWPEAAGRLASTAYCTREDLGRGQVILFLDEPLFRGWLAEPRRLFLNALLFGPGLGTRWSTPW